MERPPIIVLITAPDAQTASDIGRHLVDQRLAACCNVVSGIQSIYRWEGKTCEDAEVLMIVKSTSDVFTELESAVRRLHPYDVPEIIAVPIQQGSAGYLEWLADSTEKK